MSLFKEIYGSNPELCASAPGRVEVIGNHVDYNGGKVLGAAIDRRVFVECAENSHGRIRLASGPDNSPVEVPLSKLAEPRQGAESWANYLLGVVKKLIDNGMNLHCGIDLALSSDLPSGAGLSSSAALEMATAVLLNEWAQLGLDTKSLVRTARWAENNFVGVPCGILDQGVVGFGLAGSLVAIDCHLEHFTRVPVPAETCFWIFNSEKKHSLVDSFYADRHAECQKALSLLQKRYPEVTHLAMVTAEQFAESEKDLPELLVKRAQHVIEEQRRVEKFMEALSRGENWAATGPILTASHKSSRELFENSIPELDYLVEALVACPGVHGARLTGGGFGGAVLAVTSPSFGEPEGRAIAHAYQRRFGHSPKFLPLKPDNGARIES